MAEDLRVELGGDLLEAGGHFIQRSGQLGHFVARAEVDAVVEVVLLGDPP